MIEIKNNKTTETSKTYAQKISQKKRLEILEKVNTAINHHEKFKKVYFFTPPSSASSRRSYEKYHSFTINFIYGGKEYEYWCDVSCTCRYVTYQGGFSVDGISKDVRAFKKIRTELEEAIKNYNTKNIIK